MSHKPNAIAPPPPLATRPHPVIDRPGHAQKGVDRAFVLLLQGDWHAAYTELGALTSYPFTGEWRPPTTIEVIQHGE